MHHLQRYQGNPGTGWATAGAAVGGLLSGVAAVLLAGVIAAEVHRARTGEEAAALDDPYSRIWHLVIGAGMFAGASYGAYLGAAPHQRARAVTGAMIGSALVVVPNVIINPVGRGSALWGLVGGSAAAATGAAIGASTAPSRLPSPAGVGRQGSRI